MIIIQKIKLKMKDRRGLATYIELAILLLVCMMLLALSVSFFQIYAKHNLVNSMAHELARRVEVTGEVGSSTYAEFERLKLASGYRDATVSFSHSGRIPLEEPFTVVVMVPQKFGIGGIQIIPMTVKAVATGRSEVYWK